MKKIAIYTCVCGGYDVVGEPLAVWPEADYICFSDRPVESAVWEYRPAELCVTGSSSGPSGSSESAGSSDSSSPSGPSGSSVASGSSSARRHRPAETHGADSTVTSRWHKLNPHLVLPEYEYSLWIDGNVNIASAELYARIGELMGEGCLYAGLSHPSRDDVYDEAEAILKGRRESLWRLMRVTHFLHRQGFPRHSGLMETNVVLRAHNDPKIIAFDELWWFMLKNYTRRDQMSQMYCLWQCRIQPELLLPAGSCARNHPAFRYTAHGRAYLKDRSIRGLYQDAACALRKAVFRLYLRLLPAFRPCPRDQRRGRQDK